MLRKLVYKLLLKSYENYHPVYLKDGQRDCYDRWEMINKVLDEHSIFSVLDLGSSEGFYVIKAAREGCMALGVDNDIRRHTVAQDQSSLQGITGASFMLNDIGGELLYRLPEFDMVIFMSVLHHFMYLHGEDYCLSFLKKLREKVGKVMIFEMGQSDETENEWAELLPDMGDNPHEWIRKFVLLAGFSKVEKIGESDSYKKDKNRAIFRAEI